MTRIVFMGSADFSLPSLQRLSEVYQVVGVITQPDRPSGRGKNLTPPPVKILAEKLGIECFQPEKLRLPESFARLSAWQPEVIVVAAYGQILRQNVLDLPPAGCINVHASYLPRWRGAAPIQAAILNGDPSSGVTIMKMDAGVDTGGIYTQVSAEIFLEDTSESLSSRLSKLGADLLIQTLPGIIAGNVHPIPQDSELATYAPMLKKEDGVLEFSRPVIELERRVRAFFPWPGAFFTWDNQPLKVLKAHFLHDSASIPGKHAVKEKKPAVGCLDGWLILDTLQPAGKNPMSGQNFLNGARNWTSG